jgi:ribosomal protein L11 methyltransferase
LIRLVVRCGPKAAEAVLAELLVLAPGGVEQEDGPGWVEYAIYGAAGEVPDLGSIEAVAGDEPVEVRSEEIPDDWADRWRDFHEPVWISERVVIRPSWEDDGADAEVSVVVDPGQAFGTGAHPTTRMCIGLLLELADGGEASGTLSDLGTGSGVLAITAAKLGWAPVIAIDHERAALEAAGANAKANRVDLELEQINLRETCPPIADTIVANLTAPLLTGFAERLATVEWRPRALACSGLLTSQADEVLGVFGEAGLDVRSRLESGDWAALRLAPA